MTREELRETVAEAMKDAGRAAAKRGMWKKSLHHDMADAAIAIIRGETLEEAARVADDEACHCEETGSPPSDFGNAGRNDAANTIAAAIRALKEGK